MEVKRIEKYQYKGKEYKSLQDIYTELQNGLGVIIDRFDVTLTPKQKLNILKGIVKDKKTLIGLLSVEIDNSDNSLYGDFKNILDLF